jgi:hypothetical protein
MSRSPLSYSRFSDCPRALRRFGTRVGWGLTLRSWPLTPSVSAGLGDHLIGVGAGPVTTGREAPGPSPAPAGLDDEVRSRILWELRCLRCPSQAAWCAGLATQLCCLAHRGQARRLKVRTKLKSCRKNRVYSLRMYAINEFRAIRGRVAPRKFPAFLMKRSMRQQRPQLGGIRASEALLGG